MKVSVLVMTYNHVNFIDQAFESILSQQTSFDYEIVISEDFSTDGTREKVIKYREKYPKKVRLLLSSKNLHSNEVVARGIRSCHGEYIALLDGDDYWISPLKLQKQADFLDKHLDCSMCFHNAQVFYDNNRQKIWNWTSDRQKKFSTLEDILLGNVIATCSTMFRNGAFGSVPDWYSFFPITDWPLHVLNAEQGKVGYIDEVMGAYRLHENGDYSHLSQEQKLRMTFTFYQLIDYNLRFRYHNLVQASLSNYFCGWSNEYLKQGNLEQAKICFKVCLSGKPLNKFIKFNRLLKLWLILYFVPFFRIIKISIFQEKDC